ncbi:MAG: hypothetical protein D6761_08875 [Candidatus Dadabacteria bacterium]|nr:MAG: hypothetical protein D6761_08875 [Candidatus Dadabacteria bacterium]
MTNGRGHWMCRASFRSLARLRRENVRAEHGLAPTKRCNHGNERRFWWMSVHVLSVAVLLCAPPVFPGAVGAVTEVVDEIVAVVEGTPILRSDLRALRATLAQQGESDLSDDALVERRINDLLMTAWADRNHVTIDDKQIDATVQNVAEQNGMSVEELYEAVRAQGLSRVAYREMLRTQLLRMQIVQREIEPGISIDDADLIAWMREHPDRYGLEPVVAVRVGPSQQLVEVPWSTLDPAVQQWIAGNPQPGAVTEIARDGVPTQITFVRLRQADLPPLEQVREQVYAEVRRDRIERAFAQWLGQMRANAWIERR